MAYHTGATFYPGGDDSYYLPEVVSPQPQRAAEAPVNMQENVAQMEQQASWKGPQGGTQQHQQQYQGSQNTSSWNPPQSTYQPTSSNTYSDANANSSRPYQQPQYQTEQQVEEAPHFSPFPRVRNRGPNVPPSDEEREATLEAAREAVLSSNDIETQLTWAQDALTYVEVAMQNETNVAPTQGARPRTPRVEHMLREDALKVVQFLADQRHPRADFMKGTWLEFGKFGYRIDKREAYNCYLRSSEKGYARAYYRIGMQFENSNEALKAIKYYQLGVEAGDAASCYRLGMMTLLGQHGQMRDYNRGLQLVQTAAQKADDNAPQGAYVLGMLQAGELAQVSIPESLLSKNQYQARSNIEKAAFLGFSKAQVRMGQAYELGDLGCQFDPVLSLHYNALAARQGEAEAEMAISKWFLCGQEGIFGKNEEIAFTYAQRAAISGLATAQFAMGYFYEVGIYVPMDLKQAREWYQKADENGNADARKRINDVSRSKTISRKEHENISLQRIRQQHASAEKVPSLPSPSEYPMASPIQENPQSPTLTMPDPSRLSLSSTPAPYRPTSTAPYPVRDQSLNTPSPNVRPTSAFGINPRLQQQGQPQNRYSANPSPRPDNNRMGSDPASYSRNDMGPNGGRQYPDGRRPATTQPSYPGQQRLPSNQGHPRLDTNSQYLAPQQNQQINRPPSQAGQSQQGRPPQAADIGFSAPPDPRPERREQQARPLPSQQQRPPYQQAPPGSQGNRPVASNMDRPGQQHHPESQPYQPNQPVPNRQQQQQPQPKPQPQRQQQNPSIKPLNIPPSKAPASSTPIPSKKPQAVPAAAAAAVKPGQGPKTFEEMGVPQAQKESDCCVM